MTEYSVTIEYVRNNTFASTGEYVASFTVNGSPHYTCGTGPDALSAAMDLAEVLGKKMYRLASNEASPI